MLEPCTFPDHESMSRYAADWIAHSIRQLPEALVCLAAGATPIRTYQLLAEQHAAEPGLFARLRIIKLDEWGGLALDDPATCERCLRDHFVDPLGLGERYIGFDSNPRDPEAECRRIAEWLTRHGPIDFCVLGLGLNGHVGFNEPSPSLLPHAHVATLSETSLAHSMLTKSSGRPKYGLTLGMADLLHARDGLLLVSGPSKQAPVQRLMNGFISTDFPASFLTLHQNYRVLWSEETAVSCIYG